MTLEARRSIVQFDGRIREKDLIIPTLQLAASRPDGVITTSDLIKKLGDIFEPKGEDAEILDGRQDSRFSQIVRNLVSHKNSSTSIFSKGYATYHKLPKDGSIRITDEGRKFIAQFPE